MERRKDDFVDWLIKMLSKHDISQSKLAKETKIHQTYVCKIASRKTRATERVQYVIINFFKQNYGESYPLIALEKTPTTYGEWLSLETSKNNISSKELAMATGLNVETIRDIWIGRTISTIEIKMKILNCLEEVYSIDVAKGKELLKKPMSTEREEFSNWFINVMSELKISNIEVAKYVGVNVTNLSKIRKGRVVPSAKKAELIFSFFEENGIDTRKGREKYIKLHRGSIKRISNIKQ